MLDYETRKKQYITLMEEMLCAYHGRTCSRTRELYVKKKQEVVGSLARMIEGAKESLENYILCQKKGKIQYIHFSYLLSGALSGEMLVKLDFYDSRYYTDEEEIDCYWNCSGLFPDVETEYRALKEELDKKLIRLQSAEASQLRVGMWVLNYRILKMILMEMVREKQVERQLKAFCEETACLFYGAYLDEAEVIHRLKEE